jgi:hypothetical protein
MRETDIFKQALEGSPSLFQGRPGRNPLFRISGISRYPAIGNDQSFHASLGLEAV